MVIMREVSLCVYTGTIERRATNTMRVLTFALLPGQSRSSWRDRILNFLNSYSLQEVIKATLVAQMNHFEKFLPLLEKNTSVEGRVQKTLTAEKLLSTKYGGISLSQTL